MHRLHGDKGSDFLCYFFLPFLGWSAFRIHVGNGRGECGGFGSHGQQNVAHAPTKWTNKLSCVRVQIL